MQTHGRTLYVVRLYRKQRGLCHLCGGPMALKMGSPNSATRDHVIPRSRLHEHEVTGRNIKLACLECNQWKGSRTMSEIVADHCDG